MRRVCSVQQVRDADERAVADVGELALVERAASAVAARAVAMLGRVYGSSVVVLAGRGHNGVDALLAGELLARRGAVISVLLPAGSAAPFADPADQLTQSGHTGAPVDLWVTALQRVCRAGGRVVGSLPTRVDLVIDGLVGLGAVGPLRAAAADLAVAVSGRRVLAVDLPSGVDANTGVAAREAVRAEVTVTFDVLKPGLVLGAGAEHAGLIDVVDIGLGLYGSTGALGVVDASDVASWLPWACRGSDKRTRGAVGVVAGSRRYPGAAVLSVGGAVVAGAGYVRYAGPVTSSVLARWPSVVPGEGHVDAVVVGPGLGREDEVLERVRAVLAAGLPTVVDADGLAVGADSLRGRASVVTPHAREFQRLTGVDPAADPLAAVRAAAHDLGCVVLLKGASTLVAAPDGRVLIVTTGSPWLSTAGTGDVLSGAIGAYLAAGVTPLHAAAAGAFVHGLAGHLAAAGAPMSSAGLLEVWSAADRSVRLP
jgi:hydroxyethylthiazole kinase-like uncharacterized protein yjeF